MKRREFITLLGGAAAWPLAARAQNGQRRVGVLMQYAESDHEAQVRAKALEEGLEKLGRTKDRNLRLDYRWVGTDSNDFQRHAADLVSLKEDVIVAVSSAAVRALRRETQSVPIVFTQVSDPVGQGIIKSMARPGGNITGFTNYDPEFGGKWLGLLKEAAPSVAKVAVVFDPRTAPYAALYMRAIETAASSIAMGAIPLPVHTDAELESALTKHAHAPGSGLIVLPDAFTASHRKQIIELAAQLALPAIYPFRYYVVDGGMMSYGVDQAEQMRGAAGYVDRILKGEMPGDLPVQAPTKFQLTISLKAAKALAMPPTLLARADEVIE